MIRFLSRKYIIVLIESFNFIFFPNPLSSKTLKAGLIFETDPKTKYNNFWRSYFWYISLVLFLFLFYQFIGSGTTRHFLISKIIDQNSYVNKLIVVQKYLPRGVLQKSVLKAFRKFTGKHLSQSGFLIKLRAEACSFIKKKTLTQLFLCEFYKIFKSTYFIEKLWETASGVYPRLFTQIYLYLKSYVLYQRLQALAFYVEPFMKNI